VKDSQVSTSRAQPQLVEASLQAPAPRVDVKPDKETFFVTRRHSRQLAPGISIGVDDMDSATGQVQGWLWIMPDRRTIWLRDQPTQEPLVFYQNGERRELMITRVTSSSIAGYLHSDGRAIDR
jgi:hypothetical protein